MSERTKEVPKLGDATYVHILFIESIHKWTLFSGSTWNREIGVLNLFTSQRITRRSAKPVKMRLFGPFWPVLGPFKIWGGEQQGPFGPFQGFGAPHFRAILACFGTIWRGNEPILGHFLAFWEAILCPFGGVRAWFWGNLCLFEGCLVQKCAILL